MVSVEGLLEGRSAPVAGRKKDKIALVLVWSEPPPSGPVPIEGKLFDSTIADEGTWTLEDRKMVRIVLTKTKRDAANCWTSLLESEYAADPWVQDQMQRKLTLERFQKENPGFDFSGAEISGNYSKGGPDFSNLEK
ncbi:nudC domain-containing protein 2 isoform X2 [Vicugna pacos]|uniref:NudC domain-containing protein 2 isoform X2 n=1 Tax=Vicugna pacos TaxID=30538 RepID=A0ABM5C3Z9_VICPA